MGLTVSCKKTGDEFDLGYFGFARMRRTVSDIVGGQWAEHYRKLVDRVGWEQKDYDDWDKKAEELLSSGAVSEPVLNFVMTSDTEGTLSCSDCKKLLAVIGDYDDKIIYGYAGRDNPAMFRDLVRVLQACASTRTVMRWS